METRRIALRAKDDHEERTYVPKIIKDGRQKRRENRKLNSKSKKYGW